MPTTNSIRVTLKIRNDTAQAWLSKNPILSEGEFGLETDTLLLKIGDGSSQWTGLRYLNKLDSQYLTYNSSGEITFSGYMADLVGSVITTSGDTITGPLYITRDPVGQTDAANKKYVDVAIDRLLWCGCRGWFCGNGISFCECWQHRCKYLGMGGKDCHIGFK